MWKCAQRITEFRGFEELDLPKHSKVKRQMSTPNASDLEQQPEIVVDEWLDKSNHEIMQKFHVSSSSLGFLQIQKNLIYICVYNIFTFGFDLFPSTP